MHHWYVSKTYIDDEAKLKTTTQNQPVYPSTHIYRFVSGIE